LFPIERIDLTAQARRRPAGKAPAAVTETWLMEIKRIWLMGRCRVNRPRPGSVLSQAPGKRGRSPTAIAKPMALMKCGLKSK
jgi:hypothetical protein